MSETTGQRDEERQMAVPIHKQVQHLLGHYEEAATALGVWSNQIPVAIREWGERRSATNGQRERLVGELRQDAGWLSSLFAGPGWANIVDHILAAADLLSEDTEPTGGEDE